MMQQKRAVTKFANLGPLKISYLHFLWVAEICIPRELSFLSLDVCHLFSSFKAPNLHFEYCIYGVY